MGQADGLTPERVREVMLADPWFASLDEPVHDALFDAARLRWLDDEEVLYRRGDTPAAWYGMARGSARLQLGTAAGHEVVYAMVEPGAWFGDIALLDGGTCAHDCVAQGPAGVLCVPVPCFLALVDRHPGLPRALMSQQARRLRQLLAMVEEAVTQPVDVRLARHLRRLAEMHGRDADGGRRIELHLPQDRLAQWLGVSRQRVNQAMKAWQRAGLIDQRYGRVRIVDADALRALAGHD